MLYLRFYNIHDFENIEINIPVNYILDGRSTYEDWYNFNGIYEVIKKSKYLVESFSSNLLTDDLQKDKDDESILELKFGEYEYLLTIFEGTIIYESLIKNKELIALRTDDNKQALNKNKITRSEFFSYEAINDNYKYPSILVALGDKLRKEINNIICFSELENYSSSYLLEEYNKVNKLYGIDSLSIVNKYLKLFDTNLKLTDKLEIKHDTGYTLPISSSGSGLKRLFRLIPCLESTRKNNLFLIVSLFDLSLHPLITKVLISEYFKPDFRIMTRVKNVPCEFVSNPYIWKNETTMGTEN